MAVEGVSFSSQQQRVVRLHDQYRSALMNAKYYAHKLHRQKRMLLIADVLVAVSTSSAFAGFAIWKVALGQKILAVLVGVSALISVLRPVLKLSDNIDRYSKLHYGYLELFYRIEALVSEMRVKDSVSEENGVEAKAIAARYYALELEGDPYQDAKALLRFQDEIDEAVPSASLWLPSS